MWTITFTFLSCFVHHHSFSKTVSQTGMMIIPPYALPLGGQITRINTHKFNQNLQERSKPRSLTRHTNNNNQTVKINS